jgi:hypothetical protein
MYVSTAGNHREWLSPPEAQPGQQNDGTVDPALSVFNTSWWGRSSMKSVRRLIGYTVRPFLATNSQARRNKHHTIRATYKTLKGVRISKDGTGRNRMLFEVGAQFLAGSDTELAHDRAHVTLDCLQGNDKRGGDLAIAAASSSHPRDIHFTR